MNLLNLFRKQRTPKEPPPLLCRELQKSVGLPYKTRLRIQRELNKTTPAE